MSPPLSAWPPAGPDLIGPYRIEAPLDAGGMGSVYVARHTLTEARVALKVLHGQADEVATARFMREVRAASRIGHPGVVQVLDAGQTPQGALYLVMELLQGETLARRVDGGAGAEETVPLLLQSLDALAAAHAAGIVHRDLKPENLFVVAPAAAGSGAADAGPQVKLLDFGIALELATDSTRTGQVVGTPHYMSPEQARTPSRIGPASDVWAFGVMLYELLSGELPFEGETASGVVVALCTEPHVPLAARCPGVDAQLAAIVDRCLCKDPDARYADASALAAALEAHAGGGGPRPARAARPLEPAHGDAAQRALAEADTDEITRAGRPARPRPVR